MSLATDDVVKVEVWDVVDKGKNNSDTFISEILLTLYLPRSDFSFSSLASNMCRKHCALTKNNMHWKLLPDEGKFYPNGPIRVLCFLRSPVG